MSMSPSWFFQIIVCLIPVLLNSQEPFICRGDFYLSLTSGGSSNIFEVEFDPVSGGVIFEMIGEEPIGFTLNAMGFRSTDNFIYGIDELDYSLHRIGADGKPEFLVFLDGFNKNLSYPAGDVTPDGRYLVLLGGAGDFTIERGRSEALVLIDLESPVFEVRVQPLAENNVRCFDIAFDPETGFLYGFDGNSDRLVRFDLENGNVFTGFAPDPDGDAMGSVFFDAFGKLYGYGRPQNIQGQNTFFRIDKNTGNVEVLATGSTVQRSDGCSCPYTIQMENTVTPRRVLPCTEQTFTISFANASGRVQTGLILHDTFPESFEIISVLDTLGGVLVGSIGDHILQIRELDVPLGLSSIQVRVRSAAGVNGSFFNQAVLTALPGSLGGMIVSDDPETVIRYDATQYLVESLDIDLNLPERALCNGESILLAPGLGGVDYLWNDGSTGQTLTVARGGVYSVTVSTGCESVADTIVIEEHSVGVELPETADLPLGDSLRLRPVVYGTPPMSYSWFSEDAEISCQTCFEPFVRPFHDAWFSLELKDAMGCLARDSIFIRVRKERNVYIPNAFSPNGDGVNDLFFVQSRNPDRIMSFRIFSRWGELVFQSPGGMTNDERQGWDGRSRGRQMPPGVYVYAVQIEFLDGAREAFSGEVALLR